MAREKHGREPTEDEIGKWMETLREAAADGSLFA